MFMPDAMPSPYSYPEAHNARPNSTGVFQIFQNAGKNIWPAGARKSWRSEIFAVFLIEHVKISSDLNLKFKVFKFNMFWLFLTPCFIHCLQKFEGSVAPKVLSANWATAFKTSKPS